MYHEPRLLTSQYYDLVNRVNQHLSSKSQWLWNNLPGFKNKLLLLMEEIQLGYINLANNGINYISTG